MNQLLKILIIFIVCISTILIIPAKVSAQESGASTSAITPPISLLSSFFPTVTPTPTLQIGNPLLQQLNAFANPNASTSSIATSAAILSPTPSMVASVSATISGDIDASGSASDYCLTVPVILYHHVEPLAIATLLGHQQLTEDSQIFDSQIGYLVSKKYHFLSLETLVNAIINRKTIPAKSVVITIDDGYIDAYTYAFLDAKKYHVVMNFMIPTGLVGQPDYLTWDHLKEMAQSPYASIYNHTTTHAPLGQLDQSEIVQEVTTANQDLLKNLGIKNDIVVYPYGSYSDLAIQTIQSLGMIAAVSTDPGTNECLSNIYKLPRVRVGNEPIGDYGY